MSKRGRILLVIALVLFAIQLVPVPRENPPVTAEIQAPDQVRSLLESSCYDCHSNQTVWPWYSHVAPVSWLVYRDVRKARDELNFSLWGEYTDAAVCPACNNSVTAYKGSAGLAWRSEVRYNMFWNERGFRVNR